MIRTQNISKFSGVFIMAMGLFLGGCATPQETDTLQGRGEDTRNTQAAADLEIERADTRMELIALRDRIDARISDVDNRLQMMDVPAERQNDLQGYRSELVQNRERVETELRNVGEADRTTWDRVSTAAETTTQDIGDWFDRQGDRVEGWFQENDTLDQD